VTAVFEDITLGPVTGVEEDVLSGIPTEFSLSNNYPNPFNPSTQIEFALPKNEHVRLVVFNVLGREVATLINGPMDAGFHKVTFDASHLSSGVYLYRFEAGKTLLTKKMTLFK
ncbi:MAG: T9SS C-terminal target domain-containing protein, partial [Calditrichaeota bacterium]